MYERIENCDALIEYVKNCFNDTYCGLGTIIFQGDPVDFYGARPSEFTTRNGLYIVKDDYMYLLSNVEAGYFHLYAFKGIFRMDQTIVFRLPEYIREQLIFALTGEELSI